MKKSKKNREDLIANPPHRIVRISKAGRARILGTRLPHGTRPHFRYNPYADKYEYVVEFYDESGRAMYQVTADQLDWEKTIADLQRAFEEATELHKMPQG